MITLTISCEASELPKQLQDLLSAFVKKEPPKELLDKRISKLREEGFTDKPDGRKGRACRWEGPIGGQELTERMVNMRQQGMFYIAIKKVLDSEGIYLDKSSIRNRVVKYLNQNVAIPGPTPGNQPSIMSEISQAAPKTPISDETKAEIIRLHSEGLSTLEIGKRLDISDGRRINGIIGIRKILSSRKVMQRQEEKPKIDKEKVLDWINKKDPAVNVHERSQIHPGPSKEEMKQKDRDWGIIPQSEVTNEVTEKVELEITNEVIEEATKKVEPLPISRVPPLVLKSTKDLKANRIKELANSGLSPGGISDQLYEEGIVLSPAEVQEYLINSQKNQNYPIKELCPKGGIHQLDPSMSGQHRCIKCGKIRIKEAI